MAGVLPGVECARRRRSGWRSDASAVAVHGGSRRSSICLYPTNFNSIFSLQQQQKSSAYIAYQEEQLGGVAKEAKERLDERLRTQRKSSDPKRQNGSGGRWLGGGGSNSKGLSWARRLIGWKVWEDQGECAMCLDQFIAGDPFRAAAARCGGCY